MIASNYERNLLNKWQRCMSRREAEERLYELREEVNGDPYEQLHGPKYGPGVRQEEKRARARKAASKSKPVADPEHPILRKYIPEEWGTDTGGLTKAALQAMQSEIAEHYGVPTWIVASSRLQENETKIPEFLRRMSTPNAKAMELLKVRKTAGQGICLLLGDELSSMFFDIRMLRQYAIAMQSGKQGK